MRLITLIVFFLPFEFSLRVKSEIVEFTKKDYLISFKYKGELYEMYNGMDVCFEDRKGFEVTSEHIINPYSCLIINTLAQGWKMHISAKSETAESILKLVVPIIIDHQYTFKFMNINPFNDDVRGSYLNVPGATDYYSDYLLPSDSMPKELTRSLFEYHGTQFGKFIAIYFESFNAMLKISYKINEVLESFRIKYMKQHRISPFWRLSGDMQIGPSGGVYFRYGLFNSDISYGLYRVRPDMYTPDEIEKFTRVDCKEKFTSFKKGNRKQSSIKNLIIQEKDDENRFKCYQIKMNELEDKTDRRDIPINCKVIVKHKEDKGDLFIDFYNLDLKYKGYKIEWEEICHLDSLYGSYRIIQ